MLVTAVTVAALLAGVSPPVVAVAALAAASPPTAALLAGPAVIAWWFRRKKGRTAAVDEAAFCAALSAELQAGASLRHALAAAAERDPTPELAVPAREAMAGVSAPEIASHLQRALPINGRHAALAFRLAADTGAGTAAVFTHLATRATQAAESRRERDALIAQAKLSAFVVGGAPIAIAVFLVATGRIGLLTGAGTPGVAIALAGFGLVGTGLFVVWAMIKRTPR